MDCRTVDDRMDPVFMKPITVMGIIAMGVLLVAGCGSQDHADAPAAGSGQNRTQTIVAMGDSLTAGYGLAESQAWPAVLEKKLHASGFSCRVVNAGVSGETSSGALSRIDWVIASLSPKIVILETGANDGLRGIDPALTEKNIAEIVARLQQLQITVILAGMQMPLNLGSSYTTAFAKIYPSVARRYHVVRIPFFLQGVAGKPALNQADGIHPTAKGHRIIADLIYPYVVNAIENRKNKGK
jgi:acyl-CoA thioesterase-1